MSLNVALVSNSWDYQFGLIPLGILLNTLLTASTRS